MIWGQDQAKGFLHIISFKPHRFLQGGQLFVSTPHREDEGMGIQGG